MSTLDRYLKDKQPFLESVFDAIQDGIVILDRDFTIVRVNRWLEKKYASKMPLIGKKCHTVFQNRQDSCIECPCTISLETGKLHTHILPYPSAQGPSEWFEFSMFRFEDVDGKIMGAIGHVKDITERKQAEEQLKDEVNRRRILVEQSRDGIVVLDQNGKVFEANQQYAQMLGYSMEEVQQLYVWDWDTQWTKEQLLGKIREVDETGDHFETYHRRKDGTYYDVEISTNGSVYRGQKLVFCVCRDTTERNRAQKEREKLIKELQEALKEIKTLRGILPICSFCKKIRNDKGYWEQVDVYIHKHLQADISHGICPECLKKHYPEEYASINADKKKE
jgi:PAS domain S-box-containing protein